MMRNVDFLPMAKSDAVNQLEIHQDCVRIFMCCRFLIVFIEDGDLCFSNKENLSKICENGG